jgi:hypothetical protein
MPRTIWDIPGDVDRRWGKRKSPPVGVPGWAGLTVVALGLLLAGTLVWQGGKYAWSRMRAVPGESSGEATYAAAGGGVSAGSANPATNSGIHGRAIVPEWQIDAEADFRQAVADATSGNMDGAEMNVDRGADLIGEARARQLTATLDFFDLSIRALDQVVEMRPDNDRLVEHTALARIELAQMRTIVQPGVPLTLSTTDVYGGKTIAASSPAEVVATKALEIYAPISVPANTLYDPARAKADFLDAQHMAPDAEILLPPVSTLISDGIRVQGLVLSGASETLDGIYWENVTFIRTRVRYDGGEISLHSVRFADCTFGMPPNERGARLATAIALGQTSIVIE